MPKHLRRELEDLKRQILTIGGLVEEQINNAIQALIHRRAELGATVIEKDVRIDESEVELEEECLKVLALHQPVAVDLRFIIAVLKVNNDLERMGDLAVNIAQRALFLSEHPPLDPWPKDLAMMAEQVRSMVRVSLDALINLDTDLAVLVCEKDDAVDAALKRLYDIIEKIMRNDPGSVERGLRLLSAAKALERIADQATNIAEDVVFMVEGEVVRHRVEAYMAEEGREPLSRSSDRLAAIDQSSAFPLESQNNS